jgi:hypothetical protein
VNLRDTIVQAIRDEQHYFAGSDNREHHLASQVLERLADKIAAGDLTEDEASVVVPPGSTLVLRIDPAIGYDVFAAYKDRLIEELSGTNDPGFEILVVVADQLGVVQ